jgi:hypothetical protein
VTVSPLNMNGWAYTNFESEASQRFVLGPGAPPMGAGSASFTHAPPAGVHGGALHTRQFDGVYLRDVVEMSYWTYQQGADALLFQPPYVQVFLDLDDDGAVDDGIGFEPSWQNGGRFMVSSLQGTVLDPAPANVVQNDLDTTGAGVAANRWWKWDLVIGSWWGRGGDLSVGARPSDRLGAFECNEFVGGCTTLAGIVLAYPDARIISQQTGANTGGIRLQYGFGGNSDQYVGHVDELVVGLRNATPTAFDFERGPASKEECKDGGWVGFTRNQGRCVSSFQSRRKD